MAPRGYRLANTQEILREQCRWCGAQPGQPCERPGRGGYTSPMRGFHLPRMRAAIHVPLEAKK